jgi:hypothetical protein
MSCPYHSLPKRHTLPLELGGGGGRILSGAERKGRGCNYHEVDNDNDEDHDNGGDKGGGAREEVLTIVFHSISAW